MTNNLKLLLSFAAVFLLGAVAMYGFQSFTDGEVNKVVSENASPVHNIQSSGIKSRLTPPDVDKIWSDFDQRFQVLQEHMNAQFGLLMGDMKTSFYENIIEVSEQKDGKHVYVNIELGDLNSSEVDVNVENDMIEITGQKSVQNEQQSDQGQSLSRSFSSFTKSFPIPAEADARTSRVKKEEGKIVIIFDRVSV